MANSTVTADLPRRRPPPRVHTLPASQRCIGLLNGEASYPGKGCASDITYYYMAFVMADGTVRMSGTNNNNELAMEGNTYSPQHLHYLVWDNRTDAAMLTDDGDVVAWGHNGHGQQGRGHTTGNGIARSIDASDIGRASGIPSRDVTKLDLVRGSPANSSSLHALCRDGSLWAWGYGSYGNLGQGDTSHSYKPVRCKKTGDVPLADVIDFALTRDGTLWAPPRHCGPAASTRSSGSTATTATPMPAATTARASSASATPPGISPRRRGSPCPRASPRA